MLAKIKHLLSLTLILLSFSGFSQNYIEYHSNGKKKYEVEQKGNDTTFVIFYNLKGNKSVEAFYYKDTLHGKTIEWFKSKQIKLIGNYKRGIINGKWKYWYKNGKIQSQLFYINGRLDDWCFHWYQNGKMKEKAYYINGSLEGKWKTWHKNGNISEEGQCVNGKKHGLWVEYYYKGKKRRETVYENGTQITQTINWFSNGKLDYTSKRELERIKALPKNERTDAEKIILKRNLHYFKYGSYGY